MRKAKGGGSALPKGEPRAAGAPDNELWLQHDESRAPVWLPDASEQELHRALPHFVPGLSDRGKGRVERESPWHVVVPDDRQLLGNVYLSRVAGLEGAKGHQIVPHQ